MTGTFYLTGPCDAVSSSHGRVQKRDFAYAFVRVIAIRLFKLRFMSEVS